tara:strand:+ start:512 stop:1159 length:648 start_codon:yes stop_codon:yes gene_type:complete
MNSKSKKITINIYDNKYHDWRFTLKNKLNNIKGNLIEIDCNNLDLSCKEILELIEIANQYNCRIISFYSTSTKTIVSTKALGYKSNFIIEDFSNINFNLHNKDLNLSKTLFHQGTIRSGEYLESSGDLLIIGDINPGAIVSAEGNIIIWGRLLGIAHAGSKGNSEATISALQLRPVQLRIASKIARGPKEKPQLGLVEQAKIDSGVIIISPLESI